MSLAAEMIGISKFFSSTNVQANKRVNFSAESGQVHALVGENGAGKTTLMNILYGLHQPDEGEIKIDGKRAVVPTPNEAIRLGIGMVHQHFKLISSFTVAQNIMLGIEPHKYGLLRQGYENDTVRTLANSFGLPVEPTERVSNLTVGMQQRVEILKTLQRDAHILLLDEPTAVLTPQETDEFFKVLRNLAERGRTVILITHKLPEVIKVADQVTVMRQGEVIEITPVADTNIISLAHAMVGRDIVFNKKKSHSQPGEIIVEIKDLVVSSTNGAPAVTGVSFQVHKEEILGIAGVSGNGQNELTEAITGLREVDQGKVLLAGQDITRAPVWERRKLGMAHIPEDRMTMGLNLQTTLDENIIVNHYRQKPYARAGFLVTSAIRNLTNLIIERFSVASAHSGEGIATLSGGNLQKIVLGRELSGNPHFIVANQPTRGLDIGSIEFVHKSLADASRNGAGILLISVEMDEIFSLCDRIAVMYRGKIAGILSADEADEEKLGILMAGGCLEQVEGVKS
ncbi:MAG: ABC transporter ATP-binding protein [Anaerolineaceae bacterium]